RSRGAARTGVSWSLWLMCPTRSSSRRASPAWPSPYRGPPPFLLRRLCAPPATWRRGCAGKSLHFGGHLREGRRVPLDQRHLDAPEPPVPALPLPTRRAPQSVHQDQFHVHVPPDGGQELLQNSTHVQEDVLLLFEIWPS